MCDRVASPHHLLLDTGALSTTSVKMKTLHIFTGLFIVGLLAQCGLAESKARKGRTQRQAYLPPLAQKVISEEIITIHEDISGQSHFDESSYGGGKYQIFEVHNHYEPSIQNAAAQNDFSAPGYLPPNRGIHVQQGHQAQGANVNHFKPPAAPAAFSSRFQHSAQTAGTSSGRAEEILHIQHIHINQPNTANVHANNFRAPDYLPPPHGGNKGPDYLPPHQQHSTGFQQAFNAPHHTASLSQAPQQHFENHHQSQEQHIAVGQSSFQGPDYLPPHQGEQHAHHNEVNHQVSQPGQFSGSDYLPPHQIGSQHSQQPIQQSGQFEGPDYLPPHQGEQHAHHNEAQHQAAQPGQFSGPDYLPPHQIGSQNSQQPIQQSGQFEGRDYLPPHQGEQHAHHNEAQHQAAQPGQFSGPDYLPPHQIGSQHSQQPIQQSSQFKGPDYLPPHQSEQHTHQNEVSHQVQHQSQFRGPDYLPPHHNEHHHNEVPHQSHSPATFKGPDYLPPHQIGSQHSQHQVEQSGQFEGPKYSPPHQVEQHGHHNVQHHVQSEAKYKGPDYLPPHQTSFQHSQPQVQQIEQFKGPDYLPPRQGEQHAHHSEGQQEIQQSAQFKGPDYLPPHHDQQHNYQQPHVQHNAQFQSSSLSHQSHSESHALHQPSQSTTFKGPDYLPPHQSSDDLGDLPDGYDYPRPKEQVIAPQQQSNFQQPLPHPAVQPQQPHVFPGPTQLPPGYDFEKPANAEAAIAELHTLPKDDPQEFVAQAQIQVGQNQHQGHFISGQQQSVNFQSNTYLPPHSAAQQTTNYQVPQGNAQTLTNSLQQVAPQIFSPTPASAPAEAPVQSYLPPARPVQSEQYSQNLHSLSSYMNNVQSNVRYGATQFSAPRQPFREYGPPPADTTFSGNVATQQRQQHQSVALPVSPMYHDQASRSPNYAPAMSYATNSLANSYASHTAAHQQSHYQNKQPHLAFDQQTKHNLQQFMPQDIRQSSTKPIHTPAPTAAIPASAAPIVPAAPTVPVRQSTSSRVRTVQILNPSMVKTLKVLETSDHAGVKTIKILGHSNTQPSGEHHIVKVVTQNANSPHEHVQTVKIYNDHQDAPIGGSGAYLPPAARRVRQSALKQKQRQPFTGRRRYRF